MAQRKRKQSPEQKETIGRVMHEYKHGELRINEKDPKVKNPKQAIAIALHEAGATRQETPQKNRENLQKTKGKERKGETAEAEKEGKKAQDHTLKRYDPSQRRSRSTARHGGGGRVQGDGHSKTELLAEARRRNIHGRSKMSKHQLEQALRG